MPELPEVEVCRLGITPHLINSKITNVIVRHWQLRWPIPQEIIRLEKQTITKISRRAKYLVIETTDGNLILHLGMSGTVRIVDNSVAVVKHDHFDLVLANGKILRLNDPRRFGAVLWTTDNLDEHDLFSQLGPEPLTTEFSADYLIAKANKRKTPIKTFLMNNHVVVGVGNIYANEALFLAGISPTRLAGDVTAKQYETLVPIIKNVLASAIKQGGTTLKDFTQADGKPGYFAQSLLVYGRAKQPCVNCETTLVEIRMSNRSTVFCPACQPEKN